MGNDKNRPLYRIIALSHYDSLFAGFRTAKGSVIGMV